ARRPGRRRPPRLLRDRGGDRPLPPRLSDESRPHRRRGRAERDERRGRALPALRDRPRRDGKRQGGHGVKLALDRHGLWALIRHYAVLIIIVALMIYMSLISDAFLSPRNLLNILNQSTPLALIASALTLVIISGGFDLSTGAIFGVATVSAAWLAVNVDPIVGLVVAPFVGLFLGIANGLIITGLHVHSFLATLATSLVFRGIAILITGEIGR